MTTDTGFDPIPVKSNQDFNLLTRSGFHADSTADSDCLFHGSSDEGWWANAESGGNPTGDYYTTFGNPMNCFGPSNLSTTTPSWPLSENFYDEGWTVEKGWFSYGGFHDIYAAGRISVGTAATSSTTGGSLLTVQIEPDSDITSRYANVSADPGTIQRRESFTSGANKSGVIRRVGKNQDWVQLYDTGSIALASGDVLTGANGGTLTLSSTPSIGNQKAYQILLPIVAFNTAINNRFFELFLRWRSKGRDTHVLMGRLVIYGSDLGSFEFEVDDNGLNAGNGFALRKGYLETRATSSTSVNQGQWDFHNETMDVSMRFGMRGSRGNDFSAGNNWIEFENIDVRKRKRGS